MRQKTLFTSLFFVALAACASAFNVAGCGGAKPDATQRQESATQTSTPAPKPARVTPQELAKLRWIEGAWRGTGDVDKPFYERYRFENDSTLAVESFDDESLAKATDTTRFELRDGQFGNFGEGPRWVATQVTDDSVTFEPSAKARNSFRWQRESNDLWKAVLDWPAIGGKPARQRVYRMERLPAAKP